MSSFVLIPTCYGHEGFNWEHVEAVRYFSSRVSNEDHFAEDGTPIGTLFPARFEVSLTADPDRMLTFWGEVAERLFEAYQRMAASY